MVKFVERKSLVMANFRYIYLSCIASLVFLLILIVLLCVSTSSIAQDGTTLSGRLIDTSGNPIPDITVQMSRNTENRNQSDNTVQARTDSRGRFAFSNIDYKSIKLFIYSPNRSHRVRILTAEFGDISLYPFRMWGSTLTFDLESGTRMEDVIFTADYEKQSRIRTRVVYADGTPVANTRVYVYRTTHEFIRRGSGSSESPEETDAEGYFVQYVIATHHPQYYIRMVVNHQGLYAKAVPFILESENEIVLTLNGNSESINTQPLDHSERSLVLRRYGEPSASWIVNPTNTHAYKLTYKQTINQAITQASSEDAYVVAINDEAEENWLSSIYGNSRYWIGLSDAEEEGTWKWFSGEPVEYTNWEAYEPEGGNTETKDYVMTGYFGWGWHASDKTRKVHNSDKRQPIKERTILEKEWLSVNHI